MCLCSLPLPSVSLHYSAGGRSVAEHSASGPRREFPPKAPEGLVSSSAEIDNCGWTCQTMSFLQDLSTLTRARFEKQGSVECWFIPPWGLLLLPPTTLSLSFPCLCSPFGILRAPSMLGSILCCLRVSVFLEELYSNNNNTLNSYNPLTKEDYCFQR